MCIKHCCISSIRRTMLWLHIFCITNVLSINQYNDNWGVTRINTNKITYLWTINNYSLNNLKFKESLLSPIFSGDHGNEYEWQLKIYPKGQAETEKDSVALFLYLKNKANVTVIFQFHVMDGNGNKKNSHSTTHDFSGANDNWGWTDVILQSELQDKAKKFLPNDSLTVLVEITGKEGITNTSGHCRFSTNLSTTEHAGMLLDDGFLNDFQLLVGGQVFRGHRAILATHSSLFVQIFRKNPNLEMMDVGNTTAAALKQAMQFMYTGKIEINEGNAEELLSLSNQLGITQLEILSEEVLCKSMNPTNAIKILKLAELHDAKNLAPEVANYIAAHAESVADSPAFKELEHDDPNPFYGILRTIISNRKP